LKYTLIVAFIKLFINLPIKSITDGERREVGWLDCRIERGKKSLDWAGKPH
jgi:hypothetical protein